MYYNYETDKPIIEEIIDDNKEELELNDGDGAFYFDFLTNELIWKNDQCPIMVAGILQRKLRGFGLSPGNLDEYINQELESRENDWVRIAVNIEL